jgi:hypothetical protein
VHSLSTFFGAETNPPSAQQETNRYCPTVSQNRHESVADAGEQFIREAATSPDEMGIDTNGTGRFDATSREDTERVRLGIRNGSVNLMGLLTTAGFRYNTERQHGGPIR